MNVTSPSLLRRPAMPLAASVLAFAALAAPVVPLTAPSSAQVASARPERATLVALSKPVSLEVTDQPLGDLIGFVTQITGAEIEPMWDDDATGVGLDPEIEISVRARGMSALAFVELLLRKADAQLGFEGASASTWQLDEDGILQIGPRDRLNAFRRVEIYDINDLLLVIPDYDEAPDFDLQSVLQSGQGGGGGQSPFSNTDTDVERVPRAERVAAIVGLIEALVEPDQWSSVGGDASITEFQGSLIVSAPDYVHRQINGYAYWPARLTSFRQVEGRRETVIRPMPTRRQRP